MPRRFLLSCCACAALTLAPLPGQSSSVPKTAVVAKPAAAKAMKGYTAPRTPDGQPDLQGVWNNGTITRMERPADLAGKEFFTPQEAIEYEKKVVASTNRDKRQPGTQADVGQAYNDAWWDSGTKVVRTLRTSIIIDPSDGKLPPMTAEGQRLTKLRREALRRPAEGPEDRMMAERCLGFPTDGPPMLPYVYNNNFRIVQTKDTVAIMVEMIHDVRIIPLDGRPHLTQDIRRWFGDPRGHWEGDTLVVETTNFNGKMRVSFDSVASDKMRVVERFTRTDPETIVYRFTVDDPVIYTKPWSGELTLASTPGPIYEYACHEGNYGLRGLLSGARAEEKEAAKPAQ